MVDWIGRLAPFGADAEALHRLDDVGPKLLPYAALTNARRDDASPLSNVGAVYEWQGAPLVFLADADRISGPDEVHRLRRLLAMRGDAPYLGIVAPGRVDVYAIALDRKTPGRARVAVPAAGEAGKDLFALLANARPRAARTRQGWISNVVLNLLTGAIDSLVALGVANGDAISLVGRALFARFLGDRELLPDELAAPATVAGLFNGPYETRATCAWLDKTFNGDLLPLSGDIFDALPAAAFQVLGNVMMRAPGGQLYFEWAERWDRLDFAHIPVGVLSQAYELYLRKHAPEQQRKEGGYYTPRAIADLLVRASFRALERDAASVGARVLDPAAGAGVFLLTAFRELVAAQWQADGKRPDTGKLRSILYDQITGFDINEEALRFAALALYLMSIELDPEPRPIDKLKFDDLRGRVLHRVSDLDELPGTGLGSLGEQIGDDHRGRYDMVVGNPPWSSGTKLADWPRVVARVSAIATARAGIDLAPPLPNESLDLPFVWRAMEWVKPGGQIAFALHARLLFQQGDGMADARRMLFQALDVTSIVNGVELRQTRVWPEIAAPFCLLIATNRTPEPGAGFRLISPRLEPGLNAAGAMRIDAHSAEIIATQRMVATPEILKILFRGTRADLGLVERIRSRGFSTLETFWRDAIGTAPGGGMRRSGQGYQKLRKSSGPVGTDGQPPGRDASDLHHLREVSVEALDDVLVDTKKLDLFRERRVHRLRDPRNYDAPIMLVHKSPPADRGRIRVGVADEPVIYNETFYGYCARDLASGRGLTRYLALVIGSELALWFALVTSGEFGFEREVIEKLALDRMPLPDFRELDGTARAKIEDLFEKVRASPDAWPEVDAWVADLYGLGAPDLRIIRDTLAFNLPYARTKARAQARPDAEVRHLFCSRLRDELAPWARRFTETISVEPMDARPTSPWMGLVLQAGPDAGASMPAKDWEALLAIADATAATELVADGGGGTLLIGRLAQRRYWSQTQAQLLAHHLIWSRLDFFKGQRRG